MAGWCVGRRSLEVWRCILLLAFMLSGECMSMVTHQRNSGTSGPGDFRLSSASAKGASVLIDVENVRGKSGFELTHTQLLDRTTVWAERRGLVGKVSLIVDHGSEPSAYWLGDRGLSVVFGGPSLKADDVIARDVAYCQGTLGRDVVVVTADQELMRRCHRAAARSGGPDLQLVPPLNFLDDLNCVIVDRAEEVSVSDGVSDRETGAPRVPLSGIAAEIEANMEKEIRLWGAVIEAELQLKRRRGSPKKRQKLSKELFGLKEKLARLTDGPSTLDRVTVVNPNGNEGGILTREAQDELLSRWEQRRRNSARPEKTGDRVVLAERLRRQLEAIVVRTEGNLDASENPAESHAQYINAMITGPTVGSAPDQLTSEEGLSPLRLVIVSDTHGYEDSLTAPGAPSPWSVTPQEESNGIADVAVLPMDSMSIEDNKEETPLPHGDVLLHLGDFAIDGPGNRKRDALIDFDKWLARQPHEQKIVLRGNHDPFSVDFAASNATYVATPTSIEIEGWTLSLVPYVNHCRYKVPVGDLLATHVPPKAILDKCESGERAGCAFLRSAVERMPGGPPKMWVCGHIHEGRGYKYTRFGRPGSPATLVVNAANANPGPASALIHGPVIAELRAQPAEGEQARIEDQPKSTLDFDWTLGYSYSKVQVPDDVGQLLLAIDLGLRMGASLYNEQGVLLRYEQISFQDVDELHKEAPLLIETWEAEANEDHDLGNVRKRWTVTHLAIEGGDVILLDAWRAAIEVEPSDSQGNDFPGGGRGARLTLIRPEEWRADLLIPKEKSSGANAKAAARLIARQVVGDFGAMGEHSGKFKTDSAEAVTMGFYMARRLGWVQREPAVRRSSNGIVMVPRK